LKNTLIGYTVFVYGEILFSGFNDTSIIKWNDSSISQQLKQHTGSVMSLVVFNDHLWSASYDRVMIEWDWNCNVIRKFNHTSQFWCLTVFDNMIFSGHNDGSIIGWIGILFHYCIWIFDFSFNLIETRLLPQWKPFNYHEFGLSFKNEVKLLFYHLLINTNTKSSIMSILQLLKDCTIISVTFTINYTMLIVNTLLIKWISSQIVEFSIEINIWKMIYQSYFFNFWFAIIVNLYISTPFILLSLNQKSRLNFTPVVSRSLDKLTV